MMAMCNGMRCDAEVTRVDDTMVSSGFLGSVKFAF